MEYYKYSINENIKARFLNNKIKYKEKVRERAIIDGMKI